MSGLVFLKLGGSLITEKHRAHTARRQVIARLAQEIAQARQANPHLRLLLGHGSGSFGHVAAHRYATRQGVTTPEQWRGFAEVWKAAAALDQLVVDALHAAGLPALALPASAAVTARDGQVHQWDVTPLASALRAGLLPVIYGDVIFDEVRGGTILSTEDLFAYLAPRLEPQRILLAGLEPGVWADYPACSRLVDVITPQSYAGIAAAVVGSAAVDVTGGMASKLSQALNLVIQQPGLEVLIFSGETPGAVQHALSGGVVGTRIWAGSSQVEG
ncbi:MAG: isopentenyl phosphate kinase [Anaerolineales bacterium]|nr:isopentenyl phosphate kinase [Anaerolineales bacterium]